MSWEEKAAARRAFLARKIPDAWRIPPPSLDDNITDLSSTCGLLTPRELEITTSSVEHILEQLRGRTWSSESVTTAFCKRAAIAQQCLNIATEIMFDEAVQTAREYDKFLAETGRTKGPLHGLPISVKDVFDVAGCATTAGLVSRLDDIPANDGLLVASLKEAGAIPFIKTNISQACLLVESINNIFGTVLNPWNRTLSAGGSSGGEGALVAFRGSPLGIGTDGGGSLRIPAAWNGVYTIKPSSARIPGGGRGAGYSDSNTGCYGPFTNDMTSIRIWMQAVLGTEPWLKDPGVMPMPWNNQIRAPGKLRLGLLSEDGIVHSSPPVMRSLKEAAAKLQKAGHEVMELKWAELHRRAAEIIFRIYTQEGGVGIREQLEKSGEPLVPRVCTGWSEKPLTPMEIWLNHRARKAVRLDYLAAWQRLGLDAVITAPSPHPAPPHGEYITSAISAVYNLLDYPNCIIPHGRVNLEKDIASQEWYDQEPYPFFTDFPYDRGDKEMKALYTSPEVFKNAPLALQIVSLPFQEEFCIAVSETIDSIVNAKQ